VCEFEVNDDKIYALIKKDNKEYSTKIYTIMVCSKLEEKIYTKNVNGNIIETKSGFNDYGDTRVWGFYTDKDAAIEALHFNSTDMNETCYEYACLEAYDEGISNCRPHETQWFKFDHNINGYFEIETPILEKRICGRAMG
jgi:hypothetical protein